jgi:membrane protease YdiL (CAAX protease family)
MSAPALTLQAVALSLVFAPVAEELVFRHGLQASLLQRVPRAWLANVLTALLFALAHVVAQQRLQAWAVLLPALCMGWVYQRTGRLWLCVAVHAGMNAVWLLGGHAVWESITQA